MSTPPTPGGFGRHDAEGSCGGCARLPDDDVNVAPQRGWKAEQILQGVVPELATQER